MRDNKLKTSLVSAGATLDWHPFSNGFRLSAGGRYHNFDLAGSTNAMASYTIGDHTYTGAQIGKLNATVKSANPIAPYLGLGYDSAHFSASHWALALDVGVIYGGTPSSTITATNAGVIPGLPWRASFGQVSGPAPKLGGDTDAVLGDVLGYSAADIAALREAGTFG